MTMLNSKPRFAVDDADGRVFCYLTGRYFQPTGLQTLPDGTWDMAAVKGAILANGYVDNAKIEPPASPDKVAQANADFEAAVEAAIAKRAAEAQAAAGQQVSDQTPATPAS